MIPWLLVGGGTLAGMVATGAHWIAVHQWRKGEPIRPRLRDEHCFYLDEARVTARYRGPVDYDIVETTRSSIEKTLSTILKILTFGFVRKTEKAVETKYKGKVEPIAQLFAVVDELEQRANIIDVDLDKGALKPGAGLARHPGSAPPSSARLGDLFKLCKYLWIFGSFQEVTSKTDKEITFSAPCGGTAGGLVSVAGATKWLRTDRPDPREPFAGGCLVEITRPESGELMIEPLAIFRAVARPGRRVHGR